MAREDKMTIRGGYVPFSLKHTPNIDVLQDSLNKIDAKHKEALEQRTAVATAISSLDLNEKEDKFKQEYIDKTMKEIDDAASYGSYSTALSKAKEIAGRVASDQDLLARQRYQEQYKTVTDKVMNNAKLSSITKDWWRSTHEYNFVPKKDANGRTIGGNEFTEADMPVEDINWEETAKIAFDLVSEQRSSSESARGSNDDGTGFSRSSGSSVARKDSAKIKENIVYRYENDMQFKAQVDQAYKVAKWKYDEDLKKLDSMNKDSKEYKELKALTDKDRDLYSRNGSFIPYDDFVERNIYNSTYAKNLGYKHTATSSENKSFHTTKDDTTSTSGSSSSGTVSGGAVGGGGSVGTMNDGKGIQKQHSDPMDVKSVADGIVWDIKETQDNK